MMNKNIPVIDSDNFTYDETDRAFVTFASDVSRFHPVRIYDDACDVGFFLRSVKSGAKILFVEREVEYDTDGDIVCWIFSAYCLHENPEHLRDLIVRLYND